MTALSTDQRGVLRGGALAFAITLAAGALAYAWLPPPLVGAPIGGDSADRLAWALTWDIPVLLWLAACIQRVSSGRFSSPADIAGSAYAAPSPGLAVSRAVLQNSLEQTVLAIGAHLALAATLRGRELVLIPTFVALFLIGRIWFAIGYQRGPGGRSAGMVLTFAPTLAGLLLAAGLALAGR